MTDSERLLGNVFLTALAIALAVALATMFVSAVNDDNWLIAFSIVIGAYLLARQALRR